MELQQQRYQQRLEHERAAGARSRAKLASEGVRRIGVNLDADARRDLELIRHLTGSPTQQEAVAVALRIAAEQLNTTQQP